MWPLLHRSRLNGGGCDVSCRCCRTRRRGAEITDGKSSRRREIRSGNCAKGAHRDVGAEANHRTGSHRRSESTSLQPGPAWMPTCRISGCWTARAGGMCWFGVVRSILTMATATMGPVNYSATSAIAPRGGGVCSLGTCMDHRCFLDPVQRSWGVLHRKHLVGGGLHRRQ